MFGRPKWIRDNPLIAKRYLGRRNCGYFMKSSTKNSLQQFLPKHLTINWGMCVIQIITACQRTCGNVRFSVVSVSLFTEGIPYDHRGHLVHPGTLYTHGPLPLDHMRAILVETCSLWKAGSWPSTERPSCVCSIFRFYKFLFIRLCFVLGTCTKKRSLMEWTVMYHAGYSFTNRCLLYHTYSQLFEKCICNESQPLS